MNLKIVFVTLLLVLLPVNSWAAYEYFVTVNKSNEDFGSPSHAKSVLDNFGGNLTDGTAKCGTWDNCTGTCTSSTIASGEAVTWDAAASGGTSVHFTDANGAPVENQYFIDVTSGSLADGDLIDDGEGNTFEINGTPDDCQITIEMHSDDGPVTDCININVFTTDSDNYVKVTCAESDRHDGTRGTGCVMKLTGANCLYITSAYSGYEWLEVTGTLSSTGEPSFASNSTAFGVTDIFWRNLLMYDLNNSNTGLSRAILPNGGNWGTHDKIISNTIIEDVDGTGIYLNTTGGGVYSYNNTILNAGEYGIWAATTTGAIEVKNTIAIGSGISDYGNTGNIDTFTTSASGDTTGTTGLHNLVGTTEFVDFNGDDFHLTTGGTAIDAGTDLGTEFLVNIDIDGTDRDVGTYDPWDIGAHEFPTAAASYLPKMISY